MLYNIGGGSNSSVYRNGGVPMGVKVGFKSHDDVRALYTAQAGGAVVSSVGFVLDDSDVKRSEDSKRRRLFRRDSAVRRSVRRFSEEVTQ